MFIFLGLSYFLSSKIYTYFQNTCKLKLRITVIKISNSEHSTLPRRIWVQESEYILRMDQHQSTKNFCIEQTEYSLKTLTMTIEDVIGRCIEDVTH